MDSGNRDGFLLIETLPAMLLLMGILLVGLHTERVRLGIVRQESIEQQRSSAIFAVRETWLANPLSRAALCYPVEEGNWEVIDFPDDRWLPAGSDGGDGTLLWRRSLDEDVWRVEVYHSRLRQWLWWTSFHGGAPSDEE